MSKKELLDELKKKMEEDESLPLKKGTTNLVFGVGNAEAEVLCLGEGPGYWEDLKAEPFVGNAGKLLDSLLQSIELPRESIYITNVVHHRPPENRDPLPEEMTAYGIYLDKIIEIIAPQVIVTLGRFSMGKFLPTARISGVHGKKFVVKWKDKDLVIVPMYHPAAALRNGAVMGQIREDFLKLPGILEEMKNQENEVKIEQMNLC